MKDFLTEMAEQSEPKVCKRGDRNPAFELLMKRLKEYSPIIREQSRRLQQEHLITQQTMIKYPRR